MLEIRVAPSVRKATGERVIAVKRMLMVLLAAAVAGLGLAACGGGSDENGEAGAGTVAVETGEFFVRPAQDSVAAGEVTFEVTNTGEIEHEFIVYRSDAEPGSLPISDDQAELDGDAEIGEIETDELGPGATGTITVTLEAGSYILLCNLPGHYGQGQFVAFTVT